MSNDNAGEISSPGQPYRPGGETPFDMPQDVYWDITEGATGRRAGWVLENVPGVTIEEVKRVFVMQDNEVNKLDPPSSKQAQARAQQAVDFARHGEAVWEG